MKDLIKSKINTAKSLDEVKEGLLKVFHEIIKEKKQNCVGYVSGIITSDGDKYIDRNKKVLGKNTEELRSKYHFPIFSFTDIFDDEVCHRINANEVSYDEWIYFFRDILKAGYVTDIFMTPRWEESRGAVDEYETSEKLGLRIHVLPSPLDTDL